MQKNTKHPMKAPAPGLWLVGRAHGKGASGSKGKAAAALALLLALTPLLPLPGALAATVSIIGNHAGDAYGNSSDNGLTADMSPSGNTLQIDATGHVGASAYGGYTTLAGSSATGNTVVVSGGSIIVDAVGGYSQNGNATLNAVEIFSGTVYGNVYGGYAQNGDTTGNNLVISNSTVDGYVFGGLAASGASTGNTVTLQFMPNVIISALYGGSNIDPVNPIADVFTGNILMKGSNGPVGTVQNFEFISFAYSGDVNIANLNTTPGGSTQPGVQVNTRGYNLEFNGAITGSGSLIKTGAGILTLSDPNNNYTGQTEVRSGTLGLDGGRISDVLALYHGAVFDTNLTIHTLRRLETQGWAILQDASLNLAGGNLYFAVDPGLSPSGALLSVTGGGSVNVGGATVQVDLSAAAPLQVGESIILIDAGVTGVPATTTIIQAGRTYALSVNGNRLILTLISAPTASAHISNGTVSGTVASPLSGTATIALVNVTVANNPIHADASAWFTGLPAGVTVSANAQAGANTITLTFGGIPTTASAQQFSITIPGRVLAGGNPISVDANPNARFNISPNPRTPSPLPKTGDNFPLITLLALLGAGLIALVFTGIRLRMQKKSK